MNKAQDQYLKNLRETEKLLSKITLDTKTKIHTNSKDIQWDSVGTSGRVLELVTELAEFLNLEEVK